MDEPQLPRWAARLLERHPDARIPDRDEPIPPWLAEETARTPLWYLIREAAEVRSEHPFLLHREIHRQPGQWRDILDTRWDEVGALVAGYVDAGVERVITTGCGSAFFTALHGAFTLPRIAGVPTTAVESYELVHHFPPDVEPASTLVIAHSGTGGSIETVQALEAARDRGCATLAMTNTEDTPAGRASGGRTLTYVTRQECGPCTSVVSTRVLLQTMFALVLAERHGRGAEVADLRASLERAPEVGERFLEQEPRIEALANEHVQASSWLLVGSGPHYFSAREGTLKIEEQAILIGKAYRTGDFHHGALSLVAPERVVVGIEADGEANERVVDALRAAREGRSPTVAVTWSAEPTAGALADVAERHVALSPAMPEMTAPLPMTLVFQLLGYHLGVARGFNPDTLRTDHEPNARAWLTSFPLGTH